MGKNLHTHQGLTSAHGYRKRASIFCRAAGVGGGVGLSLSIFRMVELMFCKACDPATVLACSRV